jgi:predicted porin
MKKSLIALAVLAASGAAMAQSSVTLYGLIDVSVQSFKANVATASTTTAGSIAVADVRQTRMGSGIQNGSRWGLKGSEDLGGGLNAVFDLQSGFNIDTGSSAQGGLLFGRHAFVGLSGGFGTLTFGRHDTSLDDEIGNFVASAHNSVDATSGPGVSAAAARVISGATTSTSGATATANIANTAAIASAFNSVAGNVGAWVGYNSRVDNSIKFQTANYAGFTGSVTYGLGEDKTASTGATSTLSLSAKYANGPVAVLFAYQDEALAKGATQTATNGDIDLKNTLLGATYDFGVAKLYAAYNQAKLEIGTSDRKNKEYSVGVSAPVGAFTLRAEYAQSKGDVFSSVGTDIKSKGFDLEALYDLSKRTTLYTSYVSTKHDDTSTADSKTSLFAVGLRHKF